MIASFGPDYERYERDPRFRQEFNDQLTAIGRKIPLGDSVTDRIHIALMWLEPVMAFLMQGAELPPGVLLESRDHVGIGIARLAHELATSGYLLPDIPEWDEDPIAAMEGWIVYLRKIKPHVSVGGAEYDAMLSRIAERH